MRTNNCVWPAPRSMTSVMGKRTRAQDARGSSEKDAAWALRRAFDDVLDGRVRVSDNTFNVAHVDSMSLTRVMDAGDGTQTAAGRRAVGAMIREAISLGVPIYNRYTCCMRQFAPLLLFSRHAPQLTQRLLHGSDTPVFFWQRRPPRMRRGTLRSCLMVLARSRPRPPHNHGSPS
jgi:hypothetical protein